VDTTDHCYSECNVELCVYINYMRDVRKYTCYAYIMQSNTVISLHPFHFPSCLGMQSRSGNCNSHFHVVLAKSPFINASFTIYRAHLYIHANYITSSSYHYLLFRTSWSCPVRQPYYYSRLYLAYAPYLYSLCHLQSLSFHQPPGLPSCH